MNFRQLLQNLGPARLAIMGAVALGTIAFFVFLTARISAPDMALLYSDLEVDDSGKIVAKLESANVPFELRGNGTQIMVPRDQVLRLRMTLAQDGLPQGGSIGYEIFDRSSALGTTNFVQNINYVRALEGELARTIRSVDRVASARVHIVLPRRELFSRDNRDPSASIILKTSGSGPLDKSKVAAILHLVAAAVPQLSTGRISIIDDKGNLLARGGDNGDVAGALNTTLAEHQAAHEARLKRAVEEMLERTVGFGKVRASVAVEMDFDRVTVRDEKFDPEGQVVRSTQTITDTSSSQEGQGDVPVTVGTNLPEAQGQQGGGTRSNTTNERTEETVNFEISRTDRTQVHETGVVRRLSVAVMVDGTYATAGDGARTFTPRADEELQKFAALVRSAVGFDQGRGDTLEVVSMPFAGVELPEEELPPFLGLSKADYFKLGEFLVFIVLSVLMILLVIRPIISRAFKAAEPLPGSAAEMAAAELAAAETRALEGPQRTPEQIEEESMIDMAQVEGRVKASTVKKIGEIVDKHPDEALSIIRSWLYQEA